MDTGIYVSKMPNVKLSFIPSFLTSMIHANNFIRSLAMRMLRDNSTSDDSSSTAPLLVTPAAATLMGRPEGGGGSASIYPGSNMVIILAALLCVLICALRLNSLLLCARHCSCSLTRGAAAAPASTIVTRVVVVAAAPASVGGLDKRELRKIPVVEYETSNSKANGLPDTTECAICLGEFVDGEKVRLLPSCQHGFHVSCIDMWLAAHSSCPICRNSLLILEEDDHGTGEAMVVSGEAT